MMMAGETIDPARSLVASVMDRSAMKCAADAEAPETRGTASRGRRWAGVVPALRLGLLLKTPEEPKGVPKK